MKAIAISRASAVQQVIQADGKVTSLHAHLACNFRRLKDGKPSPRTICRYTENFEITAVRLSQLAGVPVQDVAAWL